MKKTIFTFLFMPLVLAATDLYKAKEDKAHRADIRYQPADNTDTFDEEMMNFLQQKKAQETLDRIAKHEKLYGKKSPVARKEYKNY